MNQEQLFREQLNSLLKSQDEFPIYGYLDLDLLSQNPDDLNSYSFFYNKYKKWISQKMHGEMNYLEGDRLLLREAPHALFPETQSVLSLGFFYPSNVSESHHQPKYARYLNGPDYHQVGKEKASKLMHQLKEYSKDAHLKWKINLDTSPVFERAWGYLNGLGWIGKNTLLIHPQWGSYFFLVTIFMNKKTGSGPRPLKDYCGQCTRCINQCPTQAFPAEKILDARKCISYLTLEYRGEIPLEKSKEISTWIAGCDLCQEVCPFNRKRVKNESSCLQAEFLSLDYLALIEETQEQYRQRTKGTALDRVKYKMFRRNLAIALRNNQGAFEPSQKKLLFKKIENYLQHETDAILLKEWSLTHYLFNNVVATNAIE